MNKKFSIQRVLIMRGLILHLFLIFSAASLASVSPSSGQGVLQKKISLSVENMKIRNILKKLEETAAIRFAYQPKLFDDNQKVSLAVEDTQLITVLGSLFDAEITFEEVGQFVIIKPILAPTLQTIAVKGKVADETGISLPGVNVLEKGTANGTVTDVEGNFTLEVESNSSVLVFSFIGYESKEVAVGSQVNLEITLRADVKKLEEVVVVGYGTQKKSDITGSVVRADLQAFRQSPNANFVQMLQGAVPGLNVGPSTAAGSTPTLQVRGRSTISGTQNVLIVLDGIIFNGSLSSINPSDIESVDVLKDASSKAIYGAAAANGVLLLTTKKGVSGRKPIINFSSSVASQNPANVLHPLNRDQFIQKVKDQKWRLAYLAPDYTAPNPSFNVREYLDNTQRQSYDDGSSFDWYGAGTHPGYLTDNQLSIRNATARFNYYVSAGYTKQKGFILNDRFDRKSIRINIEMEPLNWLTLGAQTFGAFQDFSGESPTLSTLILFSPLNTPYESDGSLNPFPNKSNLPNPLSASDSRDKDKRNSLTGNFFGVVRFPFLEGLSYRLNFGNTYLWNQRYNSNRWGGGLTGSAYKTNENEYDYTLDNIVNYLKVLYTKHSIDLTLVYGARKHTYESSHAQGSGYSDLGLGYNSLQQAQIRTLNSSAYEETFNYQTARLNYAYSSKYLLTATIRRDGFSGFAENKKWGIFPSVAVGWSIANEPFFKVSAINALKVRASYGANGNLTDRYASLARVIPTTAYVFGDGGSTLFGQQVTTLPNNNLSWESTLGSNFGVDFSVLNNRISGTIDYYNTLTRDLLFSVAIPTVGGFSSINTNVGKVRNNGIEASIRTTNIATDYFQWHTTFNFSSNNNQVAELTGSGDLVSSNLFIGQPLGAIYNYKTQGFWQIGEKPLAGFKTGTDKIVDLDENGQINSSDRTILGRTEPAYRFSLLNSFSYKAFTLTAFINSIQGGSRGYLGQQEPWGRGTGGNIFSDDSTIRNSWFRELNYWTPSNPNADFRAPGEPAAISPVSYQSRSFIRLQDVSLSYNVPKNLLGKAGLNDVRVFLSGKNLATWTKWLGWDPETGQGLVADAFPMLRAYSVGVNISL
ncbi:MAG: SusC/RagA family TonB-linked outer membrane protein [Candidatus Nephrothrix sp. EaCA]|nr:MAG: SusC/RagA family TonB-linked outer membrane protein [Candidatus Nephrothrix sp. EaCA]